MQKIEDKVLFSLSDFLNFEESPFYSHQDRLDIHRKKDDKKKQMNMTVPLLMLQISGSDYEIKRVFDFIENYIKNKENFNQETFDKIKEESKVYEKALTKNKLKNYKFDTEIEEQLLSYTVTSFRSITNLIKKLEEINFLEKDEVISFSGSDLDSTKISSYEKLVEETKEAIKKKAKIIIQASFWDKKTNFRGIPDLLVLNERNLYDVYDIKRSNTPKAKFVLQICAYSDLLKDIQGEMPDKGYILLGNNEVEEFELKDYYNYYEKSKEKFLKYHHEDYKEEKIPEANREDLKGDYSEEAKGQLKDKIDSILNIDNNDLFTLKEQNIYTKKKLLEAREILDVPESVQHRLKEQCKIEETESFKVLKQFKDEPGNLLYLSEFKPYDLYIEVKHTETLDREGFVCYYNIMSLDENGELFQKTFSTPVKKMEYKTFNEFMIYIVENFLKKSTRKHESKIYCFDSKAYELLLDVANKYSSPFASTLRSHMKYERFVFLKDYLINSFVMDVKDYSAEEINKRLDFGIEGLDLGVETSLVSLSDKKGFFDHQIKEDIVFFLQKLASNKMEFYMRLHSWMIEQREKENIEAISEENNVYFQELERLEIKKVEDRKEAKEAFESLSKELKKIMDEKAKISFEKHEKEAERLKMEEANALKKDLKEVEKEIKKLEKEEKKLETDYNKKLTKQEKEEIKEKHWSDLKLKAKEFKFDHKGYFDEKMKDRIGVLLKNLSGFHAREREIKTLNNIKINNYSLKEVINSKECLSSLKVLDTVENLEGRFPYIIKKCKYNPSEICSLGEKDSIKIIKSSYSGKIERMDADSIDVKIGISKLENKDREYIKNLSKFNIVNSSFISTESLEETIQSYFLKYNKNESHLGIEQKAIYDLLMKRSPNINGISGKLYDKNNDDILEKVIESVLNMNNTSMIIQGPPGTGKSYTASKVIEALYKRNPKLRIGISSNSNKAIDGLLVKIKETLSEDENLKDIMVAKDCDKKYFDMELSEQGVDNYDTKRTKNKESFGYLLRTEFDSYVMGATAFRIKNIEMDYLFVDEAGQVPLANLLAMGDEAKNIILIGDQNQLEQPIQGTHPGDSGDSALNYYLDINEVNKDSNNVVSEEKGFFLPVSRRMNSELCKVVSKYFYGSELKSIEDVEDIKISVELDLKGKYKNRGLEFISVNHKNNSIYAPEEISKVEEIVRDLLESDIIDKGERRKIKKEDIIIVSPFNVQVDKMKKNKLLFDMNIGTVDKFQGQEAPIVIYSQVASEVAGGGKGIEFILNPNRINVALSRGKCLAIMLGSEELLSTKIDKMEDLKLLNMLSELIEY